MFSDRVQEHIRRNEAALTGICQNVAAHMETKAKQIAPWQDRTAHARKSINGGVTKRGNTITLHISHGVRYGRYLEQGTEPHTILPKNKKALYWAGAEHPVKKVNHPGTKKHPAIVPAAEEGIKALKQELDILWGV